MTTKAIRALFWKEYRQQHQLLVALFALCVFIQIMAYLWYKVWFVGLQMSFDFRNILTLDAVFVIFYTVAATAILFAREREEQTDHFLRNLPIKGNVVFVGKISWLLGSIAILAAALLAQSTVWLLFLETGDFLGFENAVRGFALLMLSALCFGIFWSSILSRQLLSVLLTIVSPYIAFLACFLLAFAITGDHYGDWDWSRSNFFGVLNVSYTMSCLVFGGIGVWNANRWLRHKSDGKIRNRMLGIRQSLWRKKEISITQLKSQTPARGEFRWLLWQCYRQSSYLIYIGLLIPVLLLLRPFADLLRLYRYSSLFGNYYYNDAFEGTLLATIVVIGYVLCTAPFFQDHRNNAIMVLSYRGISPGKVWWSRITVFGALFIVCIASLFARYGIDGWPHGYFRYWTLGNVLSFAVFFTIAFSVGQLVSIMTRSIVLSLPLTGIGVILFYLWIIYLGFAVSQDFWINGFWPIAILAFPFLIACFVASRLRVADWMRDRKLRASWLPMTLSFVVPFAVVMIVIPCVRIFSVPGVMLGYQLDPWVLNQKIDYEANRNRLNSAIAQLKGSNDIEDYKAFWNETKQAAENPLKYSHNGGSIAESILYSSIMQQSNAENVTPEFLKNAIAFLESIPENRVPGTTLVKRHYEYAIQNIKYHWPDFGNEYMSKSKQNDEWWMILLVPWEKTRAIKYAKYRFQTDSLLAEESEQWIEQGHGDLDFLVKKTDSLSREFPSRWFYEEYFSTPVSPWNLLDRETHRRAAIITAALRLWSIEHGELPETLEQLEGTYLTKVPVIPHFLEPFEYVPHPDGKSASGLEGNPNAPYILAEINNLHDERFPGFSWQRKIGRYELGFAAPKNKD